MEHKKPVLTPNFSADYSSLENRVATLERVIRTLSMAVTKIEERLASAGIP